MPDEPTTDESALERSPIEKAYEVIIAGNVIAGASTQPPPERSALPDDAIPPPLDLEALSKLSQINGVRKAAIEAIARNTVGLGVEAVPKDDRSDVEDPEADAERRAELVATLKALSGRDTRLEHPSFLEQLLAVKTDEEECGWGFLEVSRNATTGQIDGLFHVPGKRMRRLKKRDGYVLLGPAGDTTEGTKFYPFGEKMAYDESGVVTGDLAEGRDAGVNEVLVFRLYTSESRDYGLPRDCALALEYAADKLAAESNLSFFDSGGTPPSVLFVIGEEQRDGSKVTFEVPQATVTKIGETIKSDSGHKHRVAIIPLPPGSKVQKEELGTVSERDIGNNAFRNAIARRTLGEFRLGPVFVPMVEDDGRYTAEVQRALGLEQVFDPEQTKYEDRLEPLIAELGFEGYRVRFKRLAVEGDQAKRESADAMSLVGGLTNREYRRAHGYGALPEHSSDDAEEAAKAGKVPKGWNDQLVTSPKATGDPAFGGASEGSQFPHRDQRGLEPGVGSRSRQSPEELAKHAGVPHVEDAAAALGVQYLDITADGVDRAMRRTHTVAEVVAGRVAEELAERAAANGD